MPMEKISIDEAVKLGVSSRGEKKSSKPWIPREQASGPDGKQFNYARKRDPSPTVSEEEKEGIKAPSGATRKRRATLRSEETTSPISTRKSSTAGSPRYASSTSESPSKTSPVRRNTRSDETWSARRPASGPQNRRASCSTNITSPTGYVPTSGSTSAYAFTGKSIWDIPVFKASPTKSEKSASRPPDNISPGKVRSSLQSSERLQEALIGDERAHETSYIISSSLNTLEAPAFQPPTFQTPRLSPSTRLVPQTRTPASAKTRPESEPHLSLDTVNLNSLS